jgi:hypothetical protein
VPNAVALHSAATLAVHPQLSPAVLDAIVVRPQKTYGIRTQGRTSRLELSVPCSGFGALYVQTADGEEQAIGCRDAMTLGQIQLRLYERIDVDLGTSRAGVTVYRSLQVPGRFLVLPQAYTVARFEPGDSRAYRPAMYLFSNVDAVNTARSSCVLMATLQPAVPPFRRRQLVDALRRQFHPHPTLEWPTDLAVTPTYSWAIADSGSGPGRITAAAAKTPDGFQVSLATGIEGVMQLKQIVEHAGITAGVTFPLSDGTSLASTLVVDLTRIEGPWLAGAVEASRSGGTVALTNRVEQAVDVAELLLFTGDAQSGVFPVERRLARGESMTLDGVPAADAVVPRYATAGEPGSLDEVRTFIEDIFTNVVFLSTVDFASRGLALIAVEARVVGVDGTVTGRLTAGEPAAELRFVLPLTVYLVHPTLQYRLSATAADGSVSTGPWREWRLDTQGNVISVTPTQLERT